MKIQKRFETAKNLNNANLLSNDADNAILFKFAQQHDIKSIANVSVTCKNLYNIADQICTFHFIPLRDIFGFEVLWDTVMIHDQGYHFRATYGNIPRNPDFDSLTGAKLHTLNLKSRIDYLQKAFLKPISDNGDLLMLLESDPLTQQEVILTLKMLIMLKKKKNFEKFIHTDVEILSAILNLPFNPLILKGLCALLEFHKHDQDQSTTIHKSLRSYYGTYCLSEIRRLDLEIEEQNGFLESTHKRFGIEKFYKPYPKSESAPKRLDYYLQMCLLFVLYILCTG